MRWLMIILVFYASHGLSQEHYVSYIDINNTGQFAWQVERNGEGFYLSVQTRCFNNLNTSCGGILEITSDGNIVNSFLEENLSLNSNGLFIDYDKQIYLSGEFNMGAALDLYILRLDKNLEKSEFKFYRNKFEKFYNYFSTGLLIVDKSLYTLGSSFASGECPQVGHLFKVNKDDFNIDTMLILSNVMQGYDVSHLLGSKYYQSLYVVNYYKNFSTDKIYYKIVRLDTAFHQTFEWSMEVNDNAIPRGCVTRNEDMIITIPEGFAGAYRNLWAIDTTGQVKWKWQWDANKIIKTNILRVKEAENGDLLVMGQVNGYEDYLGDIRNTAFVMRLSPDGEQKWIRYFKIADPDTRLSNYVSDLAELDNGDLQLTGQSRRIIFDADIGEYRPDQDIFWARIGGDGCINGDCSEVYTITDTEDPHVEAVIPLTIFPNPIDSDVLHVETTIRGIVDLYSQEGQQVWSATLDAGRHTIPMAGLAVGVYVVRLRTMEGKVYSEKVVRL